MGAKENAKGAAFEREARNLLREWWGCDWERTTLYGGLSKRGKPGDLVPINPMFPFPWIVECKSVEAMGIDDFLRSPDRSLLARALQQCYRERQRNAPDCPIMVLLKRRRAGILALYEGALFGSERALIKVGGSWFGLSHLTDLTKVSPAGVRNCMGSRLTPTSQRS